MNEIFLDTNVWVRLFVGDVPEQLEKVQGLFGAIEKGKIKAVLSILVVNELVWTLDKYYSFPRADYIPTLSKWIILRNIRIMEMKKEDLLELLERLRTTSIDFTDVYLGFVARGIGKIASFDKDLVKLKAKLVDF